MTPRRPAQNPSWAWGAAPMATSDAPRSVWAFDGGELLAGPGCGMAVDHDGVEAGEGGESGVAGHEGQGGLAAERGGQRGSPRLGQPRGDDQRVHGVEARPSPGSVQPERSATRLPAGERLDDHFLQVAQVAVELLERAAARRGRTSSSCTSSWVPSTSRRSLRADSQPVSCASSRSVASTVPAITSRAAVRDAEQVVAHQALVLGVAGRVVGVGRREQPPQARVVRAEQLLQLAGQRPQQLALLRRQVSWNRPDRVRFTGRRNTRPALLIRCAPWSPTGRARGGGTRPSPPSPGCRSTPPPCPCSGRRASAWWPWPWCSRTASGGRRSRRT